MVILLMLLALIFQALGYSGTCTQGSNGPFITGAILSLLLLLVSAGLLVRRLCRPKGVARVSLASFFHMLCVAGVAAFMAYFNGNLAYLTLWLGTGPCGLDYEIYAPLGTFARGDVIVGVVYFVFPLCVGVLACANLVKMAKARVASV